MYYRKIKEIIEEEEKNVFYGEMWTREEKKIWS